MTITLTRTAPTALDSLLDHLYAAPGWQHTVTIDANGASPTAIFRRVEGPLVGYSLNVPQRDDDPAWSAQAAEIAAGVERGRVPSCGLDGDVIIRAIDAINAICGPDRSGPATVGEVVALRAVLDPWYCADADDRQALRAICNGRRLEQVSERSMKALASLTVRLASLILA